jgi:hypothetical protein
MLEDVALNNIVPVPPILLAAFAMERSNCDASKVGPNGEQGVMQLTTAQCVGSPGISCQDPVCNTLVSCAAILIGSE